MIRSFMVEGAAKWELLSSCAFSDAFRTGRSAGQSSLSTTQNAVTLFRVDHHHRAERILFRLAIEAECDNFGK